MVACTACIAPKLIPHRGLAPPKTDVKIWIELPFRRPLLLLRNLWLIARYFDGKILRECKPDSLIEIERQHAMAGRIIAGQ